MLLDFKINLFKSILQQRGSEYGDSRILQRLGEIMNKAKDFTRTLQTKTIIYQEDTKKYDFDF